MIVLTRALSASRDDRQVCQLAKLTKTKAPTPQLRLLRIPANKQNESKESDSHCLNTHLDQQQYLLLQRQLLYPYQAASYLGHMALYHCLVYGLTQKERERKGRRAHFDLVSALAPQ